MNKAIKTVFGFGTVLGFIALLGCGDNSVGNPATTAPATTTAAGTGGHAAGGSGQGGSAGGTTAAGGQHNAGGAGGDNAGGHAHGGSGGDTGAGGHAGGAGGSGEVNPCADVLADHAVLKFETGKHDGVLSFGAWVKFVNPNNDPKWSWHDPFDGCIAQTSLDNTLSCDFGAGLSGAKIFFIVSVHASAADPDACGWFSKITGGKVETTGTYFACHGPTLVGSFENGAYKAGGVLVPSDEEDHPQNLMFVVP